MMSEPDICSTVPKQCDAEDIPALHPATRGDIILDTTDTNHGLPGTPPVAKQLMPIVGVVKCEWKCCGGEMRGCDVQTAYNGNSTAACKEIARTTHSSAIKLRKIIQSYRPISHPSFHPS
ncbi:uncharacterized protein LOC144172189 [Haemaphysalis longicornis]